MTQRLAISHLLLLLTMGTAGCGGQLASGPNSAEPQATQTTNNTGDSAGGTTNSPELGERTPTSRQLPELRTEVLSETTSA